MTDLTDPHPCPRCGSVPVEVSRMEDPTPRYLPACACYPHPPACPTCEEPLVDGRCMDPTGTCLTPYVLVTVPVEDPLWPVTNHPR